jgi:hypothetical protein
MLSARVLRHRPRYADIVGTLALLLATSGTAYAVTALPAHSVGHKQLKTHAVTTSKIARHAVSASKFRPGAVTGAALATGAVTGQKLGPTAVTGDKIAPGAVTGDKIALGAVGSAAVAQRAIVHNDLALNSVDGSNVIPSSIGLADLVGADVTQNIAFTLAANACGQLTMTVAGAAVGEVAQFGFVGAASVPSGLVVGPMKVIGTGTVTAFACNVGSTPISEPRIGVRVITFG